VFDITTKIGFHAFFLLTALSPILVLLAIKLIFQLWLMVSHLRVFGWVMKSPVMVEDHPHNAHYKSAAYSKPLMRSISNSRYGYGKWGL